MTNRCSNCDHPNEDGALFCANCGHFLAWAASDTAGGDVEPTKTPEAPQPQPQPQPQPEPEPVPVPEPEPVLPEPAPEPPAQPAPPPEAPSDPATVVPGLVAAIDRSKALAADRARPDLEDRLGKAQQRLANRTITVAVVGEFKRGKSTLVNALIQTAACPVDADIVTAVPTLVRYGEHLKVIAHQEQPGSAATVARPVPFNELRSLVSENGKPGDVRSVELQVPHRILRSGLCLLDTPGVGGLDSAHGQMTLAALGGADAFLFVTDASQELTGPELEFLRTALQRCPQAAMVVTKTDLHHHWREIVELDRKHLRDAGLDLPLLPVSSFLRLRAARRPELNDESGFAPLVEFLARDVVRRAAVNAAATVAHDVDFVATQIAHHGDAERVVLARPEEGKAVVERLGRATERAQALGSSSAAWPQVLADGIQDLVADVEYDLQARLRQVLKDVRDIVDQSDPKETWPETEAWLRRQVAAAGVANRDLLLSRAVEVGESTATRFSLEADEGIELELDLVTHALERLELPSASTFSMPGGRLASLVIAARNTVGIPMTLLSLSQIVFFPSFLIAGTAILIGFGIGGKLLRDEGRRQLSYRQGQAKAAAAKFIDEVAFEMNKETRDALRQTQRMLRDEFQSRAQAIQVSAASALEAARRASALPPEAQARRSTELDREAAELLQIRQRLRTVSEAGAGVG